MKMDSQQLATRFCNRLAEGGKENTSVKELIVELLDDLNDEFETQAIPVTLTPYR